jgi:hypothetical protein
MVWALILKHSEIVKISLVNFMGECIDLSNILDIQTLFYLERDIGKVHCDE